jgi:hypothetical protein
MPDVEEVKATAKGEKFLKKAERQACWGARDKFWDCMQLNGEERK